MMTALPKLRVQSLAVVPSQLHLEFLEIHPDLSPSFALRPKADSSTGSSGTSSNNWLLGKVRVDEDSCFEESGDSRLRSLQSSKHRGGRNGRQPEEAAGNVYYPIKPISLFFPQLAGVLIGNLAYAIASIRGPCYRRYRVSLSRARRSLWARRHWLCHASEVAATPRARAVLHTSPGRRTNPPRQRDGLRAHPRSPLAQHQADGVPPALEHPDHRHEPPAISSVRGATTVVRGRLVLGRVFDTGSEGDRDAAERVKRESGSRRVRSVDRVKQRCGLGHHAGLAAGVLTIGPWPLTLLACFEILLPKARLHEKQHWGRGEHPGELQQRAQPRLSLPSLVGERQPRPRQGPPRAAGGRRRGGCVRGSEATGVTAGRPWASVPASVDGRPRPRASLRAAELAEGPLRQQGRRLAPRVRGRVS